MICSPCSRCPNKDLPKDICAKNCKILREVQDYHFSSRELSLSTAIDYAAENRYAVLLDRPELLSAF
jgi:hypothetical protein